MERGHKMLYVCYDNGAYMNTGFQRSGATPPGAWTTTSPVGKATSGKQQGRKDLTEIMIAHGIKYVAQASPHDPRDLVRKAAKALATDGPTFLNVLSPVPARLAHATAPTPSSWPARPSTPATGRSTRSRTASTASPTCPRRSCRWPRG